MSAWHAAAPGPADGMPAGRQACRRCWASDWIQHPARSAPLPPIPPPSCPHPCMLQGGIFQLRVTFSEGYPDKPPRVRFTSEVFHPNVRLRSAGLPCWAAACRQCLCRLNTRAAPRACPAAAGGTLPLPGLPSPKTHSIIQPAPLYCCTAVLQVYNDGTLCLDIIQDHWSPCHNICSILTSIQARRAALRCAAACHGGGWDVLGARAPAGRVLQRMRARRTAAG